GSSSGDIKLSFETIWGGADWDEGNGIAVDSNNNIYITGYTESYGARYADAFLLKYSPNGNLLWSTTWGGVNWDEGNDILVDSNNNIFITGATRSYGARYADVFLLKYNSNGSLLGNTVWGGADYEKGTGISVDSNNNIYITGYTESYGAGGYDILLLKYINNEINSPILNKRINGYSVYLVLIGILSYIYVFNKSRKHKVIKENIENI
ncbi:MAG: SBBP repeat-containing protein, partial [Promethearchaeota archaeon]